MNTLQYISSRLIICIGLALVIAGLGVAVFTYQNIAQEGIVTPEDASIPNTSVRGPLTLHSQANVIRKHMLTLTGGQTYAEMPRQIAQVDEAGDPVLDEEGETIMIPNKARDMWVTATALITALRLAMVTYLLSGLIALFGLLSMLIGIVLGSLSSKMTRTEISEH